MPHLFVADIDGVFLGLQAQPNRKVFEAAAWLMRSHTFHFVTGRDKRFLHKGFLPTLKAAIKKMAVTPLFPVTIACEYGCVYMEGDGVWWNTKAKEGMGLPEELRARVCQFAADTSGVKFQTSKQVVLTVGIDHAFALSHPAKSKQALERTKEQFRLLAEEFSDVVEFHQSTNACDLVPLGQTKARAVEWLLARLPFRPEMVHLLGDAPVDLGLADPFIKRSQPYTFWYVGQRADVSDEQRQHYALQFPSQDALYDQGALEVLTSLLQGDLP